VKILVDVELHSAHATFMHRRRPGGQPRGCAIPPACRRREFEKGLDV